MAIHIGNAYEADPEIAKFLKNKDFRHALSLGIDRDQLNEAFWLGVGTPGSVAPAPDTVYSPGIEWNKKWATLDLKQANELLDKVGLTKKDAEGYRLRTDGKGRLRLEMVTVGGQFVPYTQVGEMIKQQWKKIGIDLDVKELERNLAFTRDSNSENQMITWANDGSEMIFLFPRHALPVDAAEAHMGHGLRQGGTPPGAPPARSRTIPKCSGPSTCSAARSAQGREPVNNGRSSGRSSSSRCGASARSASRPAFMGVRIVKNNMGNVPERQVNAQHARTPHPSMPITFYFK
ncbi:MAG: hypothetical protein IPI73_13235 [Betaproteobacteria bacterium]|nr:hypothetical protein [Betaproteobacteria bacterium]